MFSDAARKDPAMTGQYDYERIENDFYPTPPKFLKCLTAFVQTYGIRPTNWWEPCAGQGHLALAMEDLTGERVTVTDLVRYPDHPERPGFANRVEIRDFLATTSADVQNYVVDGIITNPPYITFKVTDPEFAHLRDLAYKYGCVCPKTKRVSMAELFLRHALALMEPVKGRVAMFLRNEFDCASGRMDLFTSPAFDCKIVATERPRWIEGSTGSPRHNYAWFVFDFQNIDLPARAHYAHPASAVPISVQ